MTKKVVTAVAIIGLSLGLPALAGKGNGKGGGNNNVETAAQFIVPMAGPASPAVLLGDQQDPYEESDAAGQAGVKAYFMDSGNPKLELAETSDRFLVIRPQGACGEVLDDLADGNGDIVVRGDAMWFTHLSSFIDENGGLPGDLCGYDTDGVRQQCFLDMGEGDSAYAMMVLRFIATAGGKDYLYRILVGKTEDGDPSFPREPVVVTRGAGLEAGSWNIFGKNSGVSKGSVTYRAVKGKSSWSTHEFCDFYVDYDINLIP